MEKMRVVIMFLFLVILVHCQSPVVKHNTQLDATMISKINNQLSSQFLVHQVLMNKIHISCQSKLKELNRDLSREEYLTILRDEHLMVLPQEIQQQRDTLDGIARILEKDSISQLLQTQPQLALPLPNTSRWITIHKNSLLGYQQQGKAIVELFREVQLVNEDEYEILIQTLEKSSILFPYQLYNIIIRGLR